MRKKDVYNKAKQVYGIDAQITKAVEELAELQKELCRFLIDDGIMKNITEEMADVEIMIEQLKLIFENEKAVKMIKKAKIQRLSDRLDVECEFCKTNNRLSEENGFLVVGKELLFHYEFSEDDGDFIRMFVDVNYCPMCGRKL